MYPPHELLRVHQGEMLRHAEVRRQVKQAAAEARGSAPSAGRERREPALRRGLGQRRPISPA